MNVRIFFALAGLAVLSACNQATGQKDRGKLVLKTTEDSVAYGIGTDVGIRLRGQLVGADLKDSLNMDILSRGIRDGLDSIVPDQKVMMAMQMYQMEMQKKYLAKQQVEAEKTLRENEAWLAENGKRPGVITTASGLQYEVLQMGTGAKPGATDQVTVQYRGTLVNGQEFDSSYKKGQPATFRLNEVVAGWTEGLQLMPVGSKFKFYIPSNLGWGAQGAGDGIPPNSTVLFDVELLDIVPAVK
ncbi:MAG: FKBP-type peptidyl-prolyl cis-trans isomerase [Flavobacteriales bacterium]|nr:FKBP-type peptidyl-prolyl cis-trans isomerase [Flavobacteriales bacterium]MBK9287723.1 FKBP-type peptidyl-prolyl cis-trans isomerase [Flavobacteriales bacterium]MBL0035449.1 FKBP-type peptidyl-prolyl cis-trans isomerase [Flavobacteriales bacterium]